MSSSLLSSNSIKISIIIVSYNSIDFLPACLRSIAEQTDDISHEIWVVDNASADGSAELIRAEFPHVHLIANDQNLGFSKACNQAIPLTKGEYVLLLNPDTVILDRAISRLVALLDTRPDVGMAGGLVLNSDGTPQPACRRGVPSPRAMFFRAIGLDRLFPQNRFISQYNLRWLPWDEEAQVDSVSGSFQMARRSVIDQIGLLDEAIFMYGEDIDWCLRAKQCGWKVVFFPQVRILHHKGQSSRKNLARARREFYRSYLYLYDKYFARDGSLLSRWLIQGVVLTHRAVAWWFMK